MGDAYLVQALRTAGGRRGGALAHWHPVDLAAEVLNGLVSGANIDPRAIDDVIMGCVSQVGEQTMQIGRNAVIASKLPLSVPAVTIDRQCGSSQQSIHFAAQAVMSGAQDIVIAAGVESMTRVPLGAAHRLAAEAGLGSGPVSPGIRNRLGVDRFSQFQGAQAIAQKYELTRNDLDVFSLQSHQKAVAAVQAGDFDIEILPVAAADAESTKRSHHIDEGIRFDATLEAIGQVKPLQEGGSISAANASQICDGAAGTMIVSERALKEHNLTPLARIHAMTVTAGDPVVMLEEPIPGTQKALSRAGLSIRDIDLYEVNEAFASVPLAWLKATGADPQRLNVNGGAIALGHPLGASGVKLMATLVHAMRKRRLRWGLQTMCEGGGIANVTIIEVF